MELTTNFILFQLALLIILLSFSAFFSASETAFTALGRTHLHRLVEERRRGSKQLAKLLSDPQRFLSTILLANNVVNILATALATSLAIQVFHNAGVGIATAIMIFFILVFGEITPKTIAVQQAERLALLASRPICLLEKAIYPLARFLIWVSQLIIRVVGQAGLKSYPFMPEEEIKAMLKIGEEEGVIEQEERELIHSVFEFGDTLVREIMVPRPDIVALPADFSIQEAVDKALKEGFSRIPVYKSTLNNIVGIFYLKDGVTELARKTKKSKGKVAEIVRQAVFVPETKKIDDLLRDLQRNKVHVSIVFDEHGETVGLVTIEDILEEIVGEIFDEYDKAKPLVQRLKGNKLRLDARIEIDRAEKILGINFPEKDYDTLGGFISSALGKAPALGDQVSLGGWTFQIEKLDKRRITKVLALPNENPKGSADEASS